MKSPKAALAALAALALAGCAGMDLTPEGNPSRVLTGQIDLGGPAALPADAMVTVRVVDASAGMPPQVLGSQTIRNPGAAPIAFRVEYSAEDDVLRRGLNVEARVSYGGSVRYFNVNKYVVTLANAGGPLLITVNPTRA
ncbi:MAG: YbaY family lipoprotein [Opitutaceae bacterium]